MCSFEPDGSDEQGGLSWDEFSGTDDLGWDPTLGFEEDATLATLGTLSGAANALPFPLRAVSGRYRGASGRLRFELRVDVDRARPMKRLSGDFFVTSGATTGYYGSFAVNAPSIKVTATEMIVKGMGSFTWAAGAPVAQVTIPRRTILQPQAPATLRFFSTGGSPGANYLGAFESICGSSGATRELRAAAEDMPKM